MTDKIVYKEMRGYCWGLRHLKSIQHGIQGMHAQNQIFKNHGVDSDEFNVFKDWATKYETTIMLEVHSSQEVGKMHEYLTFLNEKLKGNKTAQSRIGVNSLPICIFREPDMDNARTSTFTVLPDTLFNNDESKGVIRGFLRAVNDGNLDYRLNAGILENSETPDDSLDNRYKMWVKAWIKYLNYEHIPYNTAEGMVISWLFRMLVMKGNLAP